ncbi:hypothetical protein LCGC14_3001950, partial [marine sediment metagenome]
MVIVAALTSLLLGGCNFCVDVPGTNKCGSIDRGIVVADPPSIFATPTPTPTPAPVLTFTCKVADSGSSVIGEWDDGELH